VKIQLPRVVAEYELSGVGKSTMMALKLKRTVLTIEQKVAILKKLECRSGKVVAEEYGVGKSTISDIKKKDE